MADLLECVIQIKALRETLHRVTALPSGATRGGLWEQLAETERRYAVALGTAIAGDEDAAAGGEEFVAMRRTNLAMLDRCTAAELAGLVEWPGRPSTAVADLVAIMLANDTEVLGHVRRTRPQPEVWRPS